ncbi:hypothetical protein FXO38_20697 [Capsicum annuum]|nr:hypothetical protein FXO38_20697 [Capsicum annuum]
MKCRLITGIHISEGRFVDTPARPSYSRSSQHSVPAPTHVGLLHRSTATHSAPILVPPPLQYLQTTVGISNNLPSSTVPSTSSHPRSHSDSVGSIGLKDLHLGGTPSGASDPHLGGTPSGASDPPTSVHPPALVPQPRDIDIYRGWYIIAYGVGFMPDEGTRKITTKCITRH